ncbi:MAG: hypothetical protein ABJC66_01010 [Gammaproteobacteria bacterium]
MQLFKNKAGKLLSGLAASVLLLASHAALAQTVNLAAGSTMSTLPDGQTVPMWGFTCAATASVPDSGATCAAANPNAGGNWSPVVIRVPYASTGTNLTINLTNNLSFTAGTGTNGVPTSLVIVGQLGGGLGGGGTTSVSPVHSPQGVTWPAIGVIDSSANSIVLSSGGSGYTAPPTVTLLGGGGSGATAVASISAAGVVTSVTLTSAGSDYTAAPTVTFSAPPAGTTAAATVNFTTFSTAGNTQSAPPAQLPRVQSFGTEVQPGQTSGSGGVPALTWNNLRPGTYLIESGTHPSIQAPMGLYGILIVTAPTQAYPPSVASVPTTGASVYDADLPAVLSEIDPVQNIAVDAAVHTAGFNETTVWSGQPGGCGNPASATFNTCYPPAVNYSARYYLVNGVSFDRTNIAASTAQILASGATTNAVTGNVLVRLVNAGLRMHVPSVVGQPMTLIAEDGNPLPGTLRKQNEVFMAAGKTYDVLLNVGTVGSPYAAATYPLFDRQLSLSTNNQRDGGMQSYIAVAGGATSGVGSTVTGGSQTTANVATGKAYYCYAGTTLSVSDPTLGLLGGSTGANGVKLGSSTLPGTLALQSNGTFTYTPPATGPCSVSGGAFNYTVNAAATVYSASITACDAVAGTVPAGCPALGVPTLGAMTFTSTNAQQLNVSPPGILVSATGLPLTVDATTVPTAVAGLSSLTVNADGSFSAIANGPGTYTFTYNVKNAQGVPAANPATVTLVFPKGSGLQVKLIDKDHGWQLLPDYRWVIEEDRTFWIDPKCQVNTGTATARPKDSYGRDCPSLPVEALGYNFHSAGMPVVATGCVGTVSCEAGQTLAGANVVCDVGDGLCRPDATGSGRTPLDPGQVALDPNKHYFISVMPGDGINPTVNGAGGPVTVGTTTRQFDPLKDCPSQSDFAPGTGACGHNMGGAQVGPQFDPRHNTIPPVATISLAETPLPTAKIAVLVYEDDYPLNGENDAGGGVDIIAPNEPGLGGFQIELLDQAGALGDATGQITYDMFNMPLNNSLAGTVDPISHLDACPLASNSDGIVAMVVTCPKYESDGKTLSPLAGQAVIANLYPGIYEPQAFPAADRIARGEEWLQTNTLDGGKPHEAFVRPGEPAYFQEFGPGGFHVQIGFANPKIINDRRSNASGTGLCDPLPNGGGLVCNSTITGHVHGNHMSRTPDERTYDTGSYDAFKFSSCYASLGIPDQQDFVFAKCDADGNFSMTGLPDGIYKLAVFDQWNDIMLDGLVTAVAVSGDTPVTVTATQWRTNIYTRTYLDMNGDGIPNRDASGNDQELGSVLLPIKIRYRDGSIGFQNNTDLNGYASYNEVFPFMNWLVVEPDTTRYKQTGQHVVYDAGGADDCTAGAPACSPNSQYHNLLSTTESNSLPVALRVPGAVYCTDADCSLPGESIQNSPYYGGPGAANATATTGLSSGRIDPPWKTEAWQGLLGQHSFIDFGMKPFAPGETGGIQGLVVYASTRPFDDPTLEVQLVWEPAVANVQVNLYQENIAADGTKTLKLVDTTLTTSWDGFAQGFRTQADGITPLKASDIPNSGVGAGSANDGFVPNMNCPGQDSKSGFFATLAGSKMWLDTPPTYDASGAITASNKKTLAYQSQFKCFDGWSMLNQIQPGPYDGKYQFPSIVARDPVSGRPSGTGHLNGVATTLAGTNCSICTANTVDTKDPNPVLPAGKYVVEVVTPSGYEIVKEEDKNILMGDIYIAPVTQQIAGLGNVFILPDQAALNAYYNQNNTVNATTNLGVINPRADFATPDQMWPCVGAMRVVPDVMSLFPAVGQTAPFAGATRPLCDRKEVTLHDQEQANARFFVFTKNHIAGHFVGGMTNDMASEFDPFSPQFGEKFGVPNLPIRMRDFVGDEVTRVYGDQWGAYNGLYFSSWEVNPPNPTGYAPQMSVACMNDPGPILDTDPQSPTYNTMITDPAYNPAYSNFCYETPFMPGFTAYMDTPVTPTQAFADHYNLPDSEYPDGTPMIRQVKGDVGPWIAGVKGAVVSATVSNPGTGYTTVPNVTFTGGGGSGAAATASLISMVSTVNVANRGAGYTSAPSVVFTGGGGSGAAATATLQKGVTSVQITNGGAGYNNAPTVHFGAGCSTAPQGTATISRGFGARRVTGVNITNSGVCASVPAITFTGGGGSGAAATATVSGVVTSVSLTNGGSGYTSTPSVSFSGGGGGNATATAALVGTVGSVTITSGGSGYSSAPTVHFSGTGGAAATAALSAGGTLTITAYGDRVVQNPMFAGPSAVSAPYNQKTITRRYSFGSQPATCPASGACPNVTIGGIPMTNVTWGDTSITGSVPAGIAACTVQQRGQEAAQCGELAITRGDNGKQTIDAITITVGGKTPKLVSPSSPSLARFGEFYANPLQTAIDQASPGDLIIVDAGSYRENLLMWKPVRLQGVGAAVVTINADAQPAGKMDAWRRRVSCLFGLSIDGAPMSNPASYDPAGVYSCPAEMYFRGDRIPFEGFVGWDASSNGNLAQVLQEPSLMGAYEGAAITVLGRGVNQVGSGETDLWGQTAGAGQFADGSRYVNNSSDCGTATTGATVNDYGTSNYLCNPAGIDGLSILNSSQGGGGIFIHGWGHNMQIANNRISANAGTLSGAINLGNGETPPAYILDNTICGNTGATPAPMCPPIPQGTKLNAQIPFGLNTNVHIHHNQILDNASIGDALFSGTPAGAGGVTISAGSDNYKLDHNWIAANLTSSDGGGVAHMGVSFNGSINNNFVLFNEANNPTLPVDGGGIIIMGAQEDRTLASGVECGGTTDLDCPPGIGDGTGPGLVIDSNLILGNSAEDGSGGGLRLRQTNGTEVARFPTTADSDWYGIKVTNNIIVNNVAGWDGAGVSLQDSFKTALVNNTVASNDTTASAGVLFKTLGAIDSASPPPGCLPTPDPTQPQAAGCLDTNGPHIPQPAGLVTMQNTPNMMAQINTGVTCPKGFGYGNAADTTASLKNGRCVLVGLPSLINDLFWQNRAFSVEILDSTGAVSNGATPTGTGVYDHQNIVALVPILNQSATGQCQAAPFNLPPGSSTPTTELYWDVGVRGDGLPNTNGHNLVFNSATVGAGYTLEAAATANVVAGRVTSYAVFNPGAGYVSIPTVTVDAPSGCTLNTTTCVRATATATLNGSTVHTVNPGNKGAGYTSAPNVTFTGGGITPNTSDGGPIALTAKNSIFSDGLNQANANSVGGFPNLAPGSAPVQGQYCNGARIPPEQCSTNQGANNSGMCAGYFAPAGQSETVGVAPVFTFNGIKASATVDEGNNWINMTYGPLSLARPMTTGGTTKTELLVASAATAAPVAAYTPASAVVVAGTPAGVPADFFGQTRSNTKPSIGAVELHLTQVANSFTVTSGPLNFGNWAAAATNVTSTAQTLTVTNTGTAALAGGTFTFGGGTPQPFSRPTGAEGGTCGANLAVGSSCSINVVFAPATAAAFSRTLTVAYTTATGTGTPVTLTGTGVATRATVSITPNPATITATAGNLMGGPATITFTNKAPVGGSQVAINNVAVSGGGILSYFFLTSPVAGTNTCAAVALAPQASCTVPVEFFNVLSPRGVNRAGTITFTDTGAASPQNSGLIGHAN